MSFLPHYIATPSKAYSSRRQFLLRTGAGFGSLALAAMLGDVDALGASSNRLPETGSPLSPHSGHIRPRAKSVIWLFMNGGPSHIDTWDFKPALLKHDGQQYEGFDKNTGFFTDQVGPLMKSPFAFRQYGASGTWGSEIMPALAEHVDDIAFIHSCWTETNNHSPALFQMNTGMNRMGFPCVGSWLTYGLGSMNQSLPSFIVMYDTLGRGLPKGHAQNWGAGFLPGVFQGTALNSSGQPIDNLVPAARLTNERQRSQLDFIRTLNSLHADLHPAEHELATRIESFELAYRMQTAAPEALDVDSEPAHIRSLYGLDDAKCRHFARQCLMARRFVERGVRFVQIFSGGTENEKSWDGHIDIAGNHRQFAAETDKPIAGLLADLKQRGLLEDVLVVCAGEFGRLPVAQKSAKPGRDHNPHAFTTWFAGGGVKGGCHFGETDELGHKAAVDKVSIHDLHATILYAMGIDHEKLTYKYNGRRYRLTDVSGNVIHPIFS